MGRYRKEEDAGRGRKGRHVRDLWQLLFSPRFESFFLVFWSRPRILLLHQLRREQTTSEFAGWWEGLVCSVPSSFLRSFVPRSRVPAVPMLLLEFLLLYSDCWRRALTMRERWGERYTRSCRLIWCVEWFEESETSSVVFQDFDFIEKIQYFQFSYH